MAAYQLPDDTYKGNKLSMVIFLPEGSVGLSAFENSLTPENMEKWLAALRMTANVDVLLPRFKAIADITLSDVLRSMGMQQALDPRFATFSGVARASNLFIESADSLAEIVVTEKGTKAAGRTVVIEKQPTTAILGMSHLTFYADHPFIFLIRDRESGGILFMGRVTDPRM